MIPDLIFSSAATLRFAQIAVNAGFLPGARLPDTVYYPPYFADQEYQNPDRAGYMAALAQHRPKLATVLDWEREDQFNEVMSWSEEAAQYADTIIVIPKVSGGIPRIPRMIGGKSVRLGYSVPTSNGGTDLQLWEFEGWEVHLLGGSPHRQMALCRYLNVVSADSNYIQQRANAGQFWQNGTARYAKNRYFPTLVEADGDRWGDGSNKAEANYEAFRRSCIAVYQAWHGQEVTQWTSDKQPKKTFKVSNEPLESSQMSLGL